jgi:hypothetical protein
MRMLSRYCYFCCPVTPPVYYYFWSEGIFSWPVSKWPRDDMVCALDGIVAIVTRCASAAL